MIVDGLQLLATQSNSAKSLVASLRIAHIFEQIRLGGPIYALIGLSKHLVTIKPDCHRIISLLPADPHAVRQAAAAGLAILSGPNKTTIKQELAKADIVQVHFWNTPRVNEFMATEQPSMRTLIWCHVNGLYPPHIISQSIFDFADLVAITSESSISLPVLCSQPRDQVEFINAGADFSRLDGFVPTAHDEFTVGYIGLVDFIKIHPAFVRMCAAIQVPTIRFIVCGDGDSRKEISRQAQELGILDRFTFINYTEDVRPILSQIDVLGYPLCEETYSTSELALQESMFAGIPPVVFPHGGIDQIVSHERNGLVAQNEVDYVRAIELLYHNPEERKRLGKNAATDADSKFGSQRTALKFEEVYARLMQKPKRDHRNSFQHSEYKKNFSTSPGAWEMIRSLDNIGDEDFLASLTHSDTQAEVAERRISHMGPSMRNHILQYRIYYPNDLYLRVWAGIMFSQSGRHALAAAEFKECLKNGLNYPRIRRYFNTAVSLCVNSAVKS